MQLNVVADVSVSATCCGFRTHHEDLAKYTDLCVCVAVKFTVKGSAPQLNVTTALFLLSVPSRA